MFVESNIWKKWSLLTHKMSGWPAPDINLFARLYIAAIFFLSGRTKAESLSGEGLWQSLKAYLTPSENTIFLFEEEYALPLISADMAAQFALLAETFLPILLIIGFATRLSAFSLMIMVLIIQVFVYPALWHEHIVWSAALLLLILKGGGSIALDRFIVEKYLHKSEYVENIYCQVV